MLCRNRWAWRWRAVGPPDAAEVAIGREVVGHAVIVEASLQRPGTNWDQWGNVWRSARNHASRELPRVSANLTGHHLCGLRLPVRRMANMSPRLLGPVQLTTSHYFRLLVKGLFMVLLCLAVNSWVLFSGWVMSMSPLPPDGGGWKLYLWSLVFCWGVVFMIGFPLYAVNLSKKKSVRFSIMSRSSELPAPGSIC